ncbi:hypothetical protein RRG08_023407 [Elysia crispata]|uniref:Uncharacterized protein n=1 Tax=Elysia crispata TaxID=231223 RepID=A0AAE1CX70_9GAST|nr:hypothetical protein RRG08_023407 [Elysia crispata]
MAQCDSTTDHHTTILRSFDCPVTSPRLCLSSKQHRGLVSMCAAGRLVGTANWENNRRDKTVDRSFSGSDWDGQFIQPSDSSRNKISEQRESTRSKDVTIDGAILRRCFINDTSGNGFLHKEETTVPAAHAWSPVCLILMSPMQGCHDCLQTNQSYTALILAVATGGLDVNIVLHACHQTPTTVTPEEP